MRFCTYCGSPVEDNADICTSCSRPTVHKKHNKKPKKLKLKKEKTEGPRKLPKWVKVAIITVASAAILFGIPCSVLGIIKANEAKQILAALDGHLFVVGESSNIYRTFYSFKDGKVAYERWTSDDTYGDINTFIELKNDSSIFENYYCFNSEQVYLTLHLDDAGYICHGINEGQNWRKTTPEEMEAMRQTWSQDSCNHDFYDARTIQKATCNNPGKQIRVCKLCDYEEISETTAQHTYVNGFCSVCGAKKKAETVNLQANTWYVYDNTLLYCQNCLISYASNMGQHAIVATYYAVCQNCHAVDDRLQTAAPEIGYPVDKIHTCGECNQMTLVKFKIGQ